MDPARSSPKGDNLMANRIAQHTPNSEERPVLKASANKSEQSADPAAGQRSVRRSAAKPTALQQTIVTSPAPQARLVAIPQKSLDRAKSRFKHFTLSRFAKDALPSNYVPPEEIAKGVHRAAGPKKVREFQNDSIRRLLTRLSGIKNPNEGMKIALPKAAKKQLLPSLNEKTGTVDLHELMSLIEQNTRGTQFFNKGNPVLNRLAMQARVDEILGGKGNGKK
jgi:hypothetical protein